MESAPHGDVLESFGLKNDQEIDFETAYKMISIFDNDLSRLHDDSVFPKLDYTETDELENMSLSYPMEGSNSHARSDHEHGERDETLKWRQQRDKDVVTEHLSDEQTQAKANLLSRYESSAIEHFLDSLVFQDDASTIPHQHNSTVSMADLNVTKETEKEESKYSTEVVSSLEVYVPPVVEVPQLSIKDEDIPSDVLQDPARLRKWKHVESERLRRNSTKKIFDDLVAMTRYPRIGESKIVKPQADKRVPKHTLLNYILEDLKMLLHANEELESLLRRG